MRKTCDGKMRNGTIIQRDPRRIGMVVSFLFSFRVTIIHGGVQISFRGSEICWMGNIGSKVSVGLSWAGTDFDVQRQAFHSERAYSRTQVLFLLMGGCVYEADHIILYK